LGRLHGCAAGDERAHDADEISVTPGLRVAGEGRAAAALSIRLEPQDFGEERDDAWCGRLLRREAQLADDLFRRGIEVLGDPRGHVAVELAADAVRLPGCNRVALTVTLVGQLELLLEQLDKRRGPSTNGHAPPCRSSVPGRIA